MRTAVTLSTAITHVIMLNFAVELYYYIKLKGYVIVPYSKDNKDKDINLKYRHKGPVHFY